MTSVERIRDCYDFPIEADSDDVMDPGDEWPRYGNIELRHASLRYDFQDGGAKYALRDLSIIINHGEKVSKIIKSYWLDSCLDIVTNIMLQRFLYFPCTWPSFQVFEWIQPGFLDWTPSKFSKNCGWFWLHCEECEFAGNDYASIATLNIFTISSLIIHIQIDI